MFRFAAPLFLILLATVPLIFWVRRYRRDPAMTVPTAGPARSAPPSPMVRIHRALPALKYLALVLLVLALARPQWGVRRLTVDTQGINIVLAVDLSESMAALDFERRGQMVNRLEAVKGVVREFVDDRRGDRIGMVVFGSEAYTQLQLTRDYNTIVAVLDRLEIGAAGKNTAIGDALGISLKRLADIESDANVAILLTDGRSNAGELTPAAAAEVAARQDVKVYTIGVGGRGRAPFRIRHPILGEQFVYQRVDIDEETLAAIAEATGGEYFRAEDTEALRQIYETIDAMEKTEVEVTEHANYRDLYPFLVGTALVLLALWSVLVNTRFLPVP
ncbi:MAG: VWA domain-containing protein [Desulfococcaceae bacterium]